MAVTSRNFKDKAARLRAKVRGHHKWKMFLYAAIVIACGFGIWISSTNQGWIARDSFMKTFSVDRERVVTVYSANGEVIRRFDGTYNVEFFSDRYVVIMNQRTGERVNLYGSSAVVVDESPDYDHNTVN